MRKETASILIFTLLAIGIGSSVPVSAEEHSILLGGSAGWEAMVGRERIGVVSGLRQDAALTLSSALDRDDPALDLAISFDQPSTGEYTDQQGNYRISVSPSLGVAGPTRARHGSGAASFYTLESRSSVPHDGPLVIRPQPGALFAAGKRLQDFSIEFWLYPANLENGEQLLSWTAARNPAGQESRAQRIRCQVTRNRVEWTFLDFFASPDDSRRIPATLSARTLLLPRTWTHQLLRFDAETGLLEYFMDGRLEAAVYTTETGREGAEVFTPLIGSGGTMVLGGRYTGLMDEFRVYAGLMQDLGRSKYPLEGGRATSRVFDLGTTNAAVLRLEAQAALPGDDGSGIRFFMRAADSPYAWQDSAAGWIPVAGSTPLGGTIRGRWLQVAVDLYPGDQGNSSPLLDEVRIFYKPDYPPPPPAYVSAVASDQAVDLSWRAVPDADLGGYMVYYGTAKGDYFGTDAILGVSPLNVGRRTSVHIDGLRNGTLYYFSIAAYDRADTPHIGEFSREVFARPLRTVP